MKRPASLIILVLALIAPMLSAQSLPRSERKEHIKSLHDQYRSFLIAEVRQQDYDRLETAKKQPEIKKYGGFGGCELSKFWFGRTCSPSTKTIRGYDP